MPADVIRQGQGCGMCHWCWVCTVSVLACLWSVPLASIAGLVLAILGVSLTTHGLREANHVLDQYGGNFSSIVSILVTTFTVVIVLDSLVIAFGWREQLRLARFRCCAQCCTQGAVGWCSCCIAWVLFLVMQAALWASVALAVALLLICEALCLLGLAVDNSCKGSKQGLDELIDNLNKAPINAGIVINDDDINEVCDDFGRFEHGSQQAFIGSLLVLWAQVIAIAYWLKYQTMQQIKDDEGVAGERQYKQTVQPRCFTENPLAVDAVSVEVGGVVPTRSSSAVGAAAEGAEEAMLDLAAAPQQLCPVEVSVQGQPLSQAEQDAAAKHNRR